MMCWGGNLQNTVFLPVSRYRTFALVWIRTGFNAHPDTAFFLTADQDPDPRANQCGSMRTGSQQSDYVVKQKLTVYKKNSPVLLEGSRAKNIPTGTQVVGTKAFIQGQKSRYISQVRSFVNFTVSGSGTAFPIRIRILIHSTTLHRVNTVPGHTNIQVLFSTTF